MTEEKNGDLGAPETSSDSGPERRSWVPATEVGPDEVDHYVSADPSSERLVSAVEVLEDQVRRFHVRAENYEQIIRQMQGRIERLQGDQVQALLKPVIRRFAGLHAQAVEAAERARERGERAEKDLDFFMDAIEEALGLIDVESVAAEPSAAFDSGKHHAARVVTTDDAEMDGLIQRVLRQGFTHVEAERVFLPAQVSVYRYQPSR